MAEHARQEPRTAEPAPARAAKAKPGSAPFSELLNRRSEALLGPAIQLLDRRAAITAATAPQPIQPKARPNRTGLPDGLKAGVEALSGLSMDDVRVHRSSAEPAKLGALAYAQGSDIHLGPGEEQHLPHEAWHVVQQKQGRVRPTAQLKGIGINADHALEREADLMGGAASAHTAAYSLVAPAVAAAPSLPGVVQRTPAELNAMTGEGTRWATLRAQTQQSVDERLQAMNGRFGSGPLTFATPAVLEPMVRAGAAAPTYAALMPGMGYDELTHLASWAFGEWPFTDLTGDEQALMAITHWSEVGREYGSLLNTQLWEVFNSRLGQPRVAPEADEEMREEVVNSTFAMRASADTNYRPE